jgi:hypothetical protein
MEEFKDFIDALHHDDEGLHEIWMTEIINNSHKIQRWPGREGFFLKFIKPRIYALLDKYQEFLSWDLNRELEAVHDLIPSSQERAWLEVQEHKAFLKAIRESQAERIFTQTRKTGKNMSNKKLIQAALRVARQHPEFKAELKRTLASTSGKTTYREVEFAAFRAIEHTKPRVTRGMTIKTLVEKLSRNSVVMDWFHGILTRKGRLDYQSMEVLDKPIVEWKDSHGIGEDPEFEGLVRDNAMVRGIEFALVGYRPQGAVDYSAALDRLPNLTIYLRAMVDPDPGKNLFSLRDMVMNELQAITKIVQK